VTTITGDGGPGIWAWNLGVVQVLGSGLALTNGTLSATSPGGSVTSIVAGAGLAGGTITNSGTLSLATETAGTLLGNAGTVAAVPGAIAIGSNLSLSASGTLSATGSGSVTSIVAGAGLNGGTITAAGTLSAAWNGGSVSAIGSGVTLTSGTLTAGGGVSNVVAGCITNTGATLTLPGAPPLQSSTLPAAAGFSFVNQNSATLTDHTNGPLTWICTTTLGSDQISAVHKAVPAGSWTLTANIQGFVTNVNGANFGIDDGTKVKFFQLGDNGGAVQLVIQHWNSYTSSTGSGQDAGGIVSINLPNPIWLRIIYNSVTPSLTWQYSIDGFNWFTMETESGSLFLTPTNYMFGADINHASAAAPCYVGINYLTIA